MYMGELVRLALVKFTKAGLLFGGQGSDLLFKRHQFFTKYVSEIESDKPGTFMNCYDVLEEVGIMHATDEDCANVRFICECVSSRAAYLASTGIAGLINKMDETSVTVSLTRDVTEDSDSNYFTIFSRRSALMVQSTVSIPNSTI
jgi:hexokinase